MEKDYEVDPTQFYVFSRDMQRVDVGLLIQRPPIFLHMRKRDAEFLKLRSRLMNEYYCDLKQYTAEFDEVNKYNDDVLSTNIYSSIRNIDNYPTHKLKDTETGEEKTYCGATKHFLKVDPYISDRRNFHFAGEDRTYLILKNKYTKEWEFPTGKVFFGESFFKAK